MSILFSTYALYVDTRSRHAAEQCIADVFSAPGSEDRVSNFIDNVQTETAKTSIAPANAFVLIRWCSLLLQQFAQKKTLWDTWGLNTVHALVRATYTFRSSNTRGSTEQTALRVTRRAFRKLFSSSFGHEAVSECVSALTAKATNPSPQNALVLGVFAGVCARLPQRRASLDSRKTDYNAFYVREIIGSRVLLPSFVAIALQDYFATFVSLEDLQRELVPAIEKALLRAPEIVLNDLVSPMIDSLPPHLDLSDILASNLLKPLLSSVKSTNATIKTGALHTFSVIAARCGDDKIVEKMGDEILSPVKQGKVTAADQRASFAHMLLALQGSTSLASKVASGLAPVAAKEANEAAAAAELDAISKHLKYGLSHGIAPDNATTDAFVKGLGEKRFPFKRLWALHLAETLWSVDDDSLSKPPTAALIDATVGRMIDALNEVHANPLPALQTGQIPVACAVTALCLEKVSTIPGLKSAPTIKKALIHEHALALEPKPSFLLSARIYTKLTLQEDLMWFLRALAATGPTAPPVGPSVQGMEAWAQAFIYLVVAQSVPVSVQTQAKKTLRGLYVRRPKAIAAIMTHGLVRWCIDIELDAKESTAVMARSGRKDLAAIVRCLCPPKDEIVSEGFTVDQDILDIQLIDLLVLCREDLIPRAAWIEMCLSTGTDPGDLARRSPTTSLEQILRVTEVCHSYHKY